MFVQIGEFGFLAIFGLGCLAMAMMVLHSVGDEFTKEEFSQLKKQMISELGSSPARAKLALRQLQADSKFIEALLDRGHIGHEYAQARRSLLYRLAYPPSGSEKNRIEEKLADLSGSRGFLDPKALDHEAVKEQVAELKGILEYAAADDNDSEAK
jgi:hypothetical protein